MGINCVSIIKLLMKHIGRFVLRNQLFPTIYISRIGQIVIMFLNIIVTRIPCKFLQNYTWDLLAFTFSSSPPNFRRTIKISFELLRNSFCTFKSSH